jgi:hypothetical protein
MFFRRYLCRAAAVIAAAALGAGGASSAAIRQSDTVNCVVAEVNSQMITLVDVKIVDAFGFFETGAAAGPIERRRFVLEKMIDQLVVLDLAREKVSADSVAAAAGLSGMLAKLGKEEARRRLDEFGLEPEDLLPYIEEKLRAEMIISGRFDRGVGVSLGEMEIYYAETYKAERMKKGLVVKPLIEVLGALESEIRKAKVERQAADWIKKLRLKAEILVRPDCLKN